MAARGRGRGRAPSTEPPRMQMASSHPPLEDDSRFSGSTGENTLDFASAAAAAAAAAAVYTSTGDDNLSNDVLPPPIIDADLVALPTLLPHDQDPADVSGIVPPVGLVKDDLPPAVMPASSVLPPDLQVHLRIRIPDSAKDYNIFYFYR